VAETTGLQSRSVLQTTGQKFLSLSFNLLECTLAIPGPVHTSVLHHNAWLAQPNPWDAGWSIQNIFHQSCSFFLIESIETAILRLDFIGGHLALHTRARNAHRKQG